METSVLLFLNIGTPELMLIMFAVLLLFGGNKLPQLARGLGQGIREFKDASDTVKREIHRNINSVEEDVKVNLDDNQNSGYYNDSAAAFSTSTDSEVISHNTDTTATVSEENDVTTVNTEKNKTPENIQA